VTALITGMDRNGDRVNGSGLVLGRQHIVSNRPVVTSMETDSEVHTREREPVITEPTNQQCGLGQKETLSIYRDDGPRRHRQDCEDVDIAVIRLSLTEG
jgi:hypothetical protein